MKECILLVGPAPLPVDVASRLPEAGHSVVHWDLWDVPEGRISLPARLHDELVEVRAEHAAWAYEMGRMPVGRKELQERLKAGASLSAWWCSLLYERHPKMTPHLYVIYKLRVLERLVESHGSTAVRLVGGDAVLRQTLADFCAKTGRIFAEFHEPAMGKVAGQSLLRRVYGACPALVRASARYVHWWWTVRRKLPCVLAKEPLPAALPAHSQAEQNSTQQCDARQKTAVIATYFPNVDMHAASQGRFRSRYWEDLHDVLNEQAAHAAGAWVRWLFIRFPAPQLSLDECIALRDRFREQRVDGASFHYLEEFLGHKDLWAAWFRHLRLSLAGVRLRQRVGKACIFPGSRLNFKQYALADWAESFAGWRGLERCLQYRAFLKYVRWAGPQRFTLFPLENCPWERMLTHAVHEAGHGPVFGAQHSTIRPTDFRYFDDTRTFSTSDCAAFQPDALRANGSSARLQWAAAGVPLERLGEVEALRYLYLAAAEKAADEKFASKSAPPATSARATMLARPVKRLLVLTSFFYDEVEAHLVLLARALHAGLLDGREIVLKPHPYLPVAERLDALLGKRMREIRMAHGAMAEELRPGTVVWASNSTTAALEAALKGLPVMVMLPHDDFDLCPMQDLPALIRTGSLEDVRRGLENTVPLHLPADYLNLAPSLTCWKALLGIEK